ncbi:MAG: ATP-binding cassette domain-containing protein, partial [Hyphomicrobium sp.]|nr:ATP-binding cassette domain-containing protein [Hyphomicrobium sp.]
MLDTPTTRSTAAPPILRIAGLHKEFAAANGTVEALRGVNITINKGEFICLLGASGCGKSTLLRIIAGFEKSTRGSVAVYGTEVDRPGPDRGMVFQDYALFPWLTVRDNISFGPRQRGVPTPTVVKETDRFLNMVGLTAFADRFPHQLSGGMKQRVAIAR